jgi:hypothetical protein
MLDLGHLQQVRNSVRKLEGLWRVLLHSSTISGPHQAHNEVESTKSKEWVDLSQKSTSGEWE